MANHIRMIIAEATREHWGRLFAILVSQYKDFDLAEEALQEAYLSALSHWSYDYIPKNIAAWLLQTAKNKAIDSIRRRSNYDDKLSFFKANGDLDLYDDHLSEHINDDIFPDERLKLIFTCCHPALSEQAQIALTLRTLGGLSTSQIARALLLPETTLAQRIVRAKKKIKNAKIPFKIPEPEDLNARLLLGDY